MKKTILTSTLMLASSAVLAGPQLTTGGFTGPMAQASTTVVQALEARDEALAQLTGHITHFVGDEEYIFSDGLNSIVLEIDDDKWMGLNISPQDKVTIIGEVDKDWREVKIDVKNIKQAG